MMREQIRPFRVQGRVLRLLGDQLIRDASLAVFELVKNSYDADATRCAVTLRHPENDDQAEIIVEDNGTGMTPETVRDVWLVIATDFRTKQREDNRLTPRFGRYPLGEKGLGRFAIHKLGSQIKLISRSQGAPEVTVSLNWDKLEEQEDLESSRVSIMVGEPTVFTGKAHGTRIEIRLLRETWDRAKARSLQRAISSLRSPFQGPEFFDVNFHILPKNDWLEGILDPTEVRKCALYHARGYFEKNSMVYDYEFTPPPTAKAELKGRKPPTSKHPLQRRSGRTSLPLDLSHHQIGRVYFDFHIFDREPSVLHAVTEDVRGLRNYLDANGGVRIYREGVRVFDFGEPGNDWLNLDVRRVNIPTARISNNQILGLLLLNGEASHDLIEKSNREGFLENPAYTDFQDAVLSVLTQVEADKEVDRKTVRQFFSRRGPKKPVTEEIAELRAQLNRRGILQELEPNLIRIEKQLKMFQDNMLRASVPGLAFGVLIHGAEKILKELVHSVHAGAKPPKIRKLVEQLDAMMGRLGNLLRGSGTKREKASMLITDALFNVDYRLKAHRIDAINGIESGGPDFTTRCTHRLIVGTLTNLLDNSIYWLQFANCKQPKVYLGTTRDLPGGPAIVVADNGPGFQDDPETLVQPFFTRRPDGMGLGLYLADEVMRVHHGHLLFPERSDIALPKEFSGAVVALQFSAE